MKSSACGEQTKRLEAYQISVSGTVSPNTWVEGNLTTHITGDETYSLRISDSAGGADYSSKEGANAPKMSYADGNITLAPAGGAGGERFLHIYMFSSD